MTLAENLLPRLSDWRPAGDGRHTWSEAFPAAGWTVHLAADKTDTLSCLVWELTVRRAGRASDGGLRAWAERIADQTAGLVESLKVLEVDDVRNEALLRSDTPTSREQRVSYFEILLRGTKSATLRRFRAGRW